MSSQCRDNLFPCLSNKQRSSSKRWVSDTAQGLAPAGTGRRRRASGRQPAGVAAALIVYGAGIGIESIARGVAARSLRRASLSRDHGPDRHAGSHRPSCFAIAGAMLIDGFAANGALAASGRAQQSKPLRCRSTMRTIMARRVPNATDRNFRGRLIRYRQRFQPCRKECCTIATMRCIHPTLLRARLAE